MAAILLVHNFNLLMFGLFGTKFSKGLWYNMVLNLGYCSNSMGLYPLGHNLYIFSGISLLVVVK